MATDSNSAQRLERLLAYLERDSSNLALLSDAAAAALSDGQPELAHDLLRRFSAEAALGETETNLAGLAALQLGGFDEAAQHFSALLRTHPADAALRFNLAWALAMLKRNEEALALLDEATTSDLAQAAELQVQLLHDAGEFELASQQAAMHLETHPEHAGLNAAVSVLATDLEDRDLAEKCALKGGDHVDALTTLGVLALGDARDNDAGALFRQALTKNQNAPRAWVGKGLSELVNAEYADAAKDIHKGAALFETHIGSWIAAGWAHLLANERDAARDCFDRALQIDHSFAESHGSLAVIAVLEGRAEEAKQLTHTAMRLDKLSFSAALAHSLLLDASGQPDRAQEIIERALHTPIDANGVTVAQAIAKRALLA